MTSSHGDISAWLAFCAGNSSVTGEFSPQRPVTRSFDVFVDAPGINGWENNRVAGELRRHRPHYDVIVMWKHRPVCLCHTQLYRDDSHHHVLISYIAFWTHKIPVISHPNVSVVFSYRNLIVFSRRVLKYRILILGWQFSVRSRYCAAPLLSIQANAPANVFDITHAILGYLYFKYCNQDTFCYLVNL